MKEEPAAQMLSLHPQRFSRGTLEIAALCAEVIGAVAASTSLCITAGNTLTTRMAMTLCLRVCRMERMLALEAF